MRKWAFLIPVLMLGSGLAFSLVYATDFSSFNFVVKDPVINLGGVLATSSSFSLNSSFGQEAIGISASQTLSLKSGFLYFPSPAAAAPAPSESPQVSTISGSTKFKPPAGVCDFNKDGLCDIADLSIFLHWLNKPYGLARKFDLNQDDKLDIVDISIIFYHWSK